MKALYAGNLVPNEVVTEQFLVLVKEIRQKKTGEPYLSLHLGDRTGEIEAKMWDNVPEVMDTFDRDDFIKVKGLLQIYQNRSQFTIHRLRRLEEHEVDLGDYFPCSDRDPMEMWAELQGLIGGLGNANLRELLRFVFSDATLAERYRMAPAAKSIHHACRGGLIEHVLSVCTLARLTASHYREIDLDLLLTGAILHDIGKINELSYARSFGYSADGQLLGHIVLGLRILNVAFEKLPNFPSKLRTLVEHMIISHHGELEFGSPRVPVFPEALLLHHLDNLDSKMEAMRSALQRDRHVDGEFTGWIAPLERVLLKKDRYFPATLSVPEPPPVSVEVRLESEPDGVAVPVDRDERTAPLQAPQSTAGNAVVQPRPPQERKPESRSVSNTILGEKLQAVLGLRKP
jgi:3'-5' exoribonuclease